MEELSLYPLWKQSVKIFLESMSSPGTIITEEWRCEHFGIKKPAYGTPDEFKDYQFKMLAAFEGFRRELLENHMIHLKAAGGGNYVVLPPGEQTKEAWGSGVKEINRCVSKMHVSLTHIDHSQLTADERRENTDAQAKLSFMAQMIKRAKRLRLPTAGKIAGCRTNGVRFGLVRYGAVRFGEVRQGNRNSPLGEFAGGGCPALMR